MAGLFGSVPLAAATAGAAAASPTPPLRRVSLGRIRGTVAAANPAVAALAEPWLVNGVDDVTTFNEMQQVFPSSGFNELYERYRASWIAGNTHVFSMSYQVCIWHSPLLLVSYCQVDARVFLCPLPHPFSIHSCKSWRRLPPCFV